VDDDVVFDISDTGAGIPADQLRAIFEPYVQLPTTLLDSHGGSGLGLAISHEFATAMHGELSVSSTLGRGSTFTLQLKRYSPELAASHQLMPSVMPRPASVQLPQEH
jgi:signal transduction histidine kinase